MISIHFLKNFLVRIRWRLQRCRSRKEITACADSSWRSATIVRNPPQSVTKREWKLGDFEHWSIHQFVSIDYHRPNVFPEFVLWLFDFNSRIDPGLIFFFRIRLMTSSVISCHAAHFRMKIDFNTGIFFFFTLFPPGGRSDLRAGTQRSDRRPVLFGEPIIQAASQDLWTDPRLESRILLAA